MADELAGAVPRPTLTGPLRAPPSRVRQAWLERAWLASAFIHGMLLAIILLARHLAEPAPPPKPEPGFEMVFENGVQSPHAVPNPGRFVQIPRGEEKGSVPQPQSVPKPPPQPQAVPAPEVNLLPPEMRYLPAPPPVAHAEPLPQPSRSAKSEQPRPRPVPRTNPFAHMISPNFASRSSPSVPRGLRGSRSVNLSMGLLVQGGMLRDAVPHVASPGADGDYMEQLSEYVETHKFYPEEAGRNGEQGDVTIKALIARDGTVKDVHLLQSSESRMLDLALMSMFRDKHLPPFPDDMKEAEKEFTITMTYEIVPY